jgi:hypothetical protein
MTAFLDLSESGRRSARGSLLGLARKFRSRFAIDLGQASFAARGFQPGSEPVRRRLELIGETFLAGFNSGLVEDDVEALQRAVSDVAPERRGFAVEGAAMGAAIADALMLGGDRLNAWMRHNETTYTYLAHVGAGWALARTPWRRTAILRGRDPVHGWLVFDGLGFHDAYFHTNRVLRGWRRTAPGYGARVYDQGLGRALWFISGGGIEAAIASIARLHPARQQDLWSGLGLALAYAGGASASALSMAVAAAGRLRANLAQGAAFAAEAHARAGYIPPHTHEAATVLSGLNADDAAALVRTLRTRLSGVSGANECPYEQWRRDVQRALVRS